MKSVTLFKNFNVPINDISLTDVLSDIKSGTYKLQVDIIRELIQSNLLELAGQHKKTLPAFTVSATFKGGRTIQHLDLYTHYIILDIDKLSPDILSNAFAEIERIPFTYVCFKSPSGNGLKIIVEVDSNAANHLSAFNQVADFYEKELKLPIDRSGKDITRLCFVSFDPHLFINAEHVKFKLLDIGIVQTEKKESLPNTPREVDAEIAYCVEITEKKIQYQPNNRNNFIYQLACNCNRLGIQLNDALSHLCRAYDLPLKEMESTIKSAYKHNQHEFDSLAINVEYVQNEPTIVNEDILLNMPYIPEDIFKSLPTILQEGCEVFENRREKDIFLTGALTILSGCFDKVEGVYDQKTVYPNLNCFIVAPAASGKGSFSFAKGLGMSYHKKVINLSIEEKRTYEQALLQYKNELKNQRKKGNDNSVEPPEKPPFKIVFIPGNSSSAAVIQHLMDSEGKGIFCETEADTIGNSLKQDWGGYSDLIRKAFHHESVSYSRKTNNEYFEIERPKLSMAVSGTPSQVCGLVNSAEDGLFSRIIFYVFKNKPEWRDVAPKLGKPILDKHFEVLSNKVLDAIEFLELYPTEFDLTREQWNTLNSEFTNWLNEVANFVGEEATSVVKRLGVILYRIAMILTVLRKFENGLSERDIQCEDIDFDIALKLVAVYKEHATYMFGTLPKSGIINNKLKEFYLALPESFKRKECLLIGKKVNIKERTIDKYLTELVKMAFLDKTDFGLYNKKTAMQSVQTMQTMRSFS